MKWTVSFLYLFFTEYKAWYFIQIRFESVVKRYFLRKKAWYLQFVDKLSRRQIDDIILIFHRK